MERQYLRSHRNVEQMDLERIWIHSLNQHLLLKSHREDTLCIQRNIQNMFLVQVEFENDVKVYGIQTKSSYMH